MKFLISLISAANVASAIQLTNEFIFVPTTSKKASKLPELTNEFIFVPTTSKKASKLPELTNEFIFVPTTSKKNKLTTINFAQTVM
jgi:hypothetical protein